MQIVSVLPYYEPAWQFGGPVTQAHLVCRRLAERGHEVRVITTDRGIGSGVPRDTWLERDGCLVWYGGTWPWHRPRPYYSPMLHHPLEQSLPGADALYMRVGLTLTNALARRLAQRHRVPYVYNAEGSLAPERLSIQRRRKLLFLRMFERRVLRDAAGLHAATEVEAEHYRLQGAHLARVHIIPNGVELPVIEKCPPGQLFRKRFGIPPDVPLVLFLGRLERMKGLPLLLDVIARAANTIHRMMLAVVGPDEGCRASLEKQAWRLGIRQRIRFTGLLTGRLRQAAFRAADVFALPAYEDMAPNAVLEACAYGVPVLVSDRCHLRQVATYGAGCVEPALCEPMAEALCAMLNDPGPLRQMGKNGRDMVARCFSVDRVVSRLEALFTNLRSPADDMAAAGAGP